MPLFVCEKCECVENTAVSEYWINKSDGNPLICSECGTGEWHNMFPKKKHDGIYNDSFCEYTNVFGYNTGKTATKDQILKGFR